MAMSGVCIIRYVQLDLCTSMIPRYGVSCVMLLYCCSVQRPWDMPLATVEMGYMLDARSSRLYDVRSIICLRHSKTPASVMNSR